MPLLNYSTEKGHTEFRCDSCGEIIPGSTINTFGECKECGARKKNTAMTYSDNRGWVFFVRGGIGSEEFKTFYRKPGLKKEKGWSGTPWRPTFQEAQTGLDNEAARRGWAAR